MHQSLKKKRPKSSIPPMLGRMGIAGLRCITLIFLIFLTISVGEEVWDRGIVNYLGVYPSGIFRCTVRRE